MSATGRSPHQTQPITHKLSPRSLLSLPVRTLTLQKCNLDLDHSCTLYFLLVPSFEPSTCTSTSSLLQWFVFQFISNPFFHHLQYVQLHPFSTFNSKMS